MEGTCETQARIRNWENFNLGNINPNSTFGFILCGFNVLHGVGLWSTTFVIVCQNTEFEKKM